MCIRDSTPLVLFRAVLASTTHTGNDFGGESPYFFDRAINHSNRDSLYFTDQAGQAGSSCSAEIVIPANGFLVLARDREDR